MNLFKSIKQKLRRLVIPPRLVREIEAMHQMQGRVLTELNRNKQSTSIQDYEFGIHSQWGEDGIIQHLISKIPIANRTFIEFGVEDFAESNCRFLMVNNNWRGYVIDGSAKWIRALRASNWFWKYDLQTQCAMITRDNVGELLAQSGFDRDLGIMSIDVDGVDYWLLEAALKAYAPRILIVEYNALFGPERSITVPYDAAFSRRQAHFSQLYFGASLGALHHLASRNDYELVGTESAGVNAFFVRRDVLGAEVKALTPKEGFTDSRLRQGLTAKRKLALLNRASELAQIRGLPVVNVVTGATEAL